MADPSAVTKRWPVVELLERWGKTERAAPESTKKRCLERESSTLRSEVGLTVATGRELIISCRLSRFPPVVV